MFAMALGMELFEKLQANKIDLPISLIAGHADSPAAIHGMQAGVFIL